MTFAVNVWFPMGSVPCVRVVGFTVEFPTKNWIVPVIGGLVLAPVTVSEKLTFCPKLMLVALAVSAALVA